MYVYVCVLMSLCVYVSPASMQTNRTPTTHTHTEWSVHANDQLSPLPFCPLLHRAYEGGGHNRCNLKRAQVCFPCFKWW